MTPHRLTATLSLCALLTTAASTFAQNYFPAPTNPATKGETAQDVPPFLVRPGYKVSLAAKSFGEGRFLELDPATGTVFVSQPSAGTITALHSSKSDGVYDQKLAFVAGYPKVHGLCVHNGTLYFSTTGAIYKTQLPTTFAKAGKVDTVIPDDDLPSGGSHWFRSLLVTDDHLYTSIGDDGNINEPTGGEREDREKIWRYKLDGSDKHLFASGIRNTEKLRSRPDPSGKDTGEIWGCDHGSDNFGGPLHEQARNRQGKELNQPVTDYWPPEKFNHYVDGGFYGHPYLAGTRIPRYEYMNRPDILELASKMTVPEWFGGAHWANNGFTFLHHPNFSGQTGDALICYHGSWNNSHHVGYRLQLLRFDPWTGHPAASELILSTLAPDGSEKVLARPVDALELPDGSVLMTSDAPNALYRITRTTPAAPNSPVAGPSGATSLATPAKTTTDK